MAKQQERAGRTRRALIEAAAAEIDRNGYDRTSLVRICQLAQISMGALTFHFPTKAELADEISALGGQATRAAVGRVSVSELPELQVVVELTLALARLLEGDSRVRSAARLARERPEVTEPWVGSWLPAVRDLLARADRGGQLRPGTDPSAVAALVVYVMAGVEAYIRAVAPDAPEGAARPWPQGQDRAVAGQLDLIWELVLHGIEAGPD